MTKQTRRDEAGTRSGGAPEGGYRGSLPPRNDGLARPWVVIVIATFVLIFVLSWAGLPESLFPSATPTPSASASASASASTSAAASESGASSASAAASGSPSPSTSP